MADYKLIRVNPASKKLIKKMAKDWGKTETNFANQMISFIFETKLDIYSEMTPSASDLIKNLDNRMVSFLKKREQQFFIPMQKSFHEMIKLHNQTLETLDILHPGEIGFKSKINKMDKKDEKPMFQIPEKKSMDPVEQTISDETPNPQGKITESTKGHVQTAIKNEEDCLDRIERIEKERKIYEKEIKFLIENILPNRSISGPRFTCNLPQKEIDRIKLLLS